MPESGKKGSDFIRDGSLDLLCWYWRVCCGGWGQGEAMATGGDKDIVGGNSGEYSYWHEPSWKLPFSPGHVPTQQCHQNSFETNAKGASLSRKQKATTRKQETNGKAHQ